MQSEPLFLHIIGRDQARALGMKKYFTGEACSIGGIAQRFVSSYQCICRLCAEKASVKKAAWRDSNAEWVKARDAAYQAANREKIAAYRAANAERTAARRAAYYEANAEKIAASKSRYRSNNAAKISEYNAEYRRANAGRIAERGAAYNRANATRIAARRAAWVAANKETLAAYAARYNAANVENRRAYAVANAEKRAAYASKRRARKLNAAPIWLSELDNLVFIEAADLARRRQQTTGIDWHVDHMIPLQARNACGLHCAANLQVIPARLNLQKLNNMVFTEPAEWLMEI